MRYSKQRELILQAVREEAVHPTADHVYAKLKHSNPELSLGTVYRNLNLLCDTGKLRRIEVLGGSDHFDGNLTPHFHMVCSKCGEVHDIPYEAAPELQKHVQELTGHVITSYDIAFTGICKNCQNVSLNSSAS